MFADPNAFFSKYACTLFNAKRRPKPFSEPVAVIPIRDTAALLKCAGAALRTHYVKKYPGAKVLKPSAFEGYARPMLKALGIL